MKKTIVALLALAGVTMGDETTVSSSYGKLNGQDQAYGFILSLSDRFMEYSGGELGETFELASVTLHSTNSGSSAVASSAKLVIFERQGKDAFGSYVALSESANFQVGDTTYNFSESVTLDTSKQYQFFFVAADTTSGVFSEATDIAAAYSGVAALTRFDKFNVQAAENYTTSYTLPQGDGIIWNRNYTGWSGQNMAVVTFTAVPTPAPAVPEPTTATLSLLALTGLAARCRR